MKPRRMTPSMLLARPRRPWMCVSLLLLQKSRDVWGIFRVVYISVCHMTKCYYYEGPDGLSLRLWDLRDIPFTHPACTVVPGS